MKMIHIGLAIAFSIWLTAPMATRAEVVEQEEAPEVPAADAARDEAAPEAGDECGRFHNSHPFPGRCEASSPGPIDSNESRMRREHVKRLCVWVPDLACGQSGNEW